MRIQPSSSGCLSRLPGSFAPPPACPCVPDSCAARPDGCKLNATTSDPPAASMARRVRPSNAALSIAMLQPVAGGLDAVGRAPHRTQDAHMGAAAAQVDRHVLADL